MLSVSSWTAATTLGKLPWRSIMHDFRREIWYQCGLREHITNSLCEHTGMMGLFLTWTASLGTDHIITAGVNGVSVSSPQWVTLRYWNENECPFAEGLCSEYIFFECWYFHRQKFAEKQAFWTEVSCTMVVVLDHLRMERHQGYSLDYQLICAPNITHSHRYLVVTEGWYGLWLQIQTVGSIERLWSWERLEVKPLILGAIRAKQG